MPSDKKYLIGGKVFDFSSAYYIMGILNSTPDSFSDGGKFLDKDVALEHALDMVNQGVDIVDIGGESSRPGAEPVSLEEEINRTIPLINDILSKGSCIISIDTYKSEVARKALEAGAVIVNDISAGTFDIEMMNVVAGFDATYIAMHTTDRPSQMQKKIIKNDFLREIYEFLYNRANLAVKKGIEKIIIDPGIGFGKTPEQNVEIINNLGFFKSIGFPILIGVSRKSFFGTLMNLKVEERDVVTVLAEVTSFTNGANILRTHNYAYAIQARNFKNIFN